MKKLISTDMLKGTEYDTKDGVRAIEWFNDMVESFEDDSEVEADTVPIELASTLIAELFGDSEDALMEICDGDFEMVEVEQLQQWIRQRLGSPMGGEEDGA